MKKFLLLFFVSFAGGAQQDFGYLEDKDQKHFRNDSFEGQNKMERIDSNVKEINKIIGEMAKLKSELKALRDEVEELKKKK